jgi:virginiamycin A acetyltransferase
MRERVHNLPGVYTLLERRRERRGLAHLVPEHEHFLGPSFGKLNIFAYPGDTAVVRIGAFVSIARGVTFIPGGNHKIDWVTTYALRERFALPGASESGHPWSKGDIVIGNDVWLGHEALVLSGVTIGNGAIVGARAVVTKDVRPYAIVAGNPARERSRRFSDDQVEELERIAWWDWPFDKIIREVPMLNGATVDEFIERFSGESS